MTITRNAVLAASLVASAGLLACGRDDDSAAIDRETFSAVTIGAANDTITPEGLERGRNDPAWRNFTGPEPASRRVSRGADPAPVSATVTDSITRLQALLDRAHFSPGIIDGRWGKNTEKALFWFQRANGLEASGEPDRQTMARLAEAAGSPQSVVIAHTLTQEDVAGPFVQLPEDVYERADMECLCYESLEEQLSERFHSSPELLKQLNPGVDLNSLSAGDRLTAPDVRESGPEPAGTVARIVISDGGHWLHAVDSAGRVLYHFPSTLGSDYAPSPTGEFSVTSIHHDPTWHYQPGLLTGVPDDKEDAILPPGPNNAVGVVWMQLSKDHYGIHGTAAPETIGYATSHGCVRLTNWDATLLAERISAGTPLEFIDAA